MSSPRLEPAPFPPFFQSLLFVPTSPFFFPPSSAGPFTPRQCPPFFLIHFSFPLSLLLFLFVIVVPFMHSRLWSSCFFFFIIISIIIVLPRHLALAAPLNRRSPSSSSEESSAPAAIVWSSPAPGDRFGPGDTIRGEWQVTSESQNQKVVSPSFRLCAGGEDGCGATIWPEVIVEESTGYYYISLYVWRCLFLSSLE
jgi:hypothetical protein